MCIQMDGDLWPFCVHNVGAILMYNEMGLHAKQYDGQNNMV